MLRALPGSHAPRPARGAPLPCFTFETPERCVYEIWTHPEDTGALTGEVVVDGRRGHGEVVDRLAFADQVRIVTVGAAA